MQRRATQFDRRALVASLRERYGAASRQDKTRILQEFVAISGYHRESAIRVLNGTDAYDDPGRHRSARTYAPSRGIRMSRSASPSNTT